MSQLAKVLADEAASESVSWLELLLPIVGWIVLAVGLVARRMSRLTTRQPSNISA